MRGMVRRAKPLLAAAVLAALGLTGPAGLPGQQIGLQLPTATPDTAPAEREPKAIPVADIPLRADQAISRLRSLQAQLGEDPDVAAIEQMLPGELELLAREHERVGRVFLELQSLRELQNLKGAWSRHEARLLDWKSTFQREWSWLRDAYADVAVFRQTWNLTREAEVAEPPVSDGIVERIDAVLASANDVEARIRRHLDWLLGLDQQIEEALSGINGVLRDVADAEEGVRARLLVRTAPPLWSPDAWKMDPDRGLLRGAWREEWRAVRGLLQLDADRVLLHVLVFLFLLLVAVRLRTRLEHEPGVDDPALHAAAETLARPVSAAAVLAILLSEPLHPGASFTVFQVLGLLAIVPLYRLIPRSRVALVNRSLQAVLVLVALSVLFDLFFESSTGFRFLTLALGVVIAAGAWWLVRRYAAPAEERRLWGRIVLQGLRIAIGVAVVAVLANALGWTLLAHTLLTALIGAAYAALGTVIAYRVLAGMVRLIPYSRVGRASRALRLHGDLITGRIVRALRVVAFPVWIWLTLQYFEFEILVARWLRGLFGSSIRIGILDIPLAGVLNFAVTLLLTVWLARFVRFVLDEEVLPRVRLERGVASAISTVTQWTIVAVGLLAAAGAAGLGASQLALVAGALGVGIGFGLQNIVNNFVSGLILIFEQPVKVGDMVEITHLQLTGEVRRIGIRSSVVRTFDGAEVIVPNANLISSEVVNWTLSDQRRRIHTEVGVAYGTDPHQVIEILNGVADANPEVLSYPEPQVLFLGFGDSSLDFRLLAWTGNFPDYLRLRSELHVATHDALKDAAIQIPFPQRDLHVRSTVGAESETPASAPSDPDDGITASPG